MSELLKPQQTEPPIPALLLDARTAAKSLAISERSLWELTARGDLPYVKVGRRTLYSPVQLQRWIDRQQAGSEA